ncbi:MAG: beta-galactosidase [Candidatus Magasanikbacteria bacterium]
MSLQKKLLIFFGIVLLIAANVWYLFSDSANPKNEKIILGTSFSPDYARYLGLDVGEVYKVILDDWKFRYLRLTARWDEVEPKSGKFDFSELDYLLNEAAKRNAKVVLAAGQKTPRWPECNVPDWAVNLSDDQYHVALNNYLKNVAEHFKNNPALETWQVENEPFLEFGDKCRTLDVKKLQTEISTIKNTDPKHLVMVTDSGELSFWNKTAKAGDIFGSTAYRVVWSKRSGYFNYDWLPAAFYRAHAKLYGLNLKNVYISELQAEPWMPNMAISVENIDEQLKSMNLDRMQKQIDFAKQTGFSRAYLWGAEWWYWLKIHGYSGMADYFHPID